MNSLLFLDINNVLSSRAWRASRSPLGPPGEIAFEPTATMALRPEGRVIWDQVRNAIRKAEGK